MSEFERMVFDMRNAQKAWYRYHDQLDLTRAKALERKVDAALERKAALDQVPDLFGAETADTRTATDQHGGATPPWRRGILPRQIETHLDAARRCVSYCSTQHKAPR